MGRKPTWKNSELQLIKDKAGTLKDKELAQELSTLLGKTVSVQSVRKQRQKLGLVKQSGRGKCAIKSASNPNTPHTTSTVPTYPTTSVVSSVVEEAPFDVVEEIVNEGVVSHES